MIRTGILHSTFYASIPIVLATFVCSAQSIIYYEPHSGHTEVVDSSNAAKFATPTVVHDRVGGRTRAGNLTWNISYADVTGNTNYGFDDPSLGSTRRDTVVAVLDYINTILNENTGATIDVSFNTSQSDGSGFLASAGTFFFTGTGFSSGFAQQHITTGTDPSGGNPDITCTVDFGFNWNSDLGDPLGSEYDLFTVLLHEMTHGLGFLNGSDSSGASIIGGKYGILAQGTENDDGGAIGTGSSTALWVAPGSYTGSAGNLTGGRLVYTGSNAVSMFGSNPTIYSENPYISGSSLSHWGDDQAGLAVMPRFVFNGAKLREYADFEIGALQDLGYTNAASPVPPTPPDTDQDLLSDDDEINIYGTDPNNPDTDGDGVRDGIEVALGTDPLNPFDFPLLPLGHLGLILVTVALLTTSVGVLYRRTRTARAKR